MSYQTVVKTVAHSNGLYADFSPKPLKDRAGCYEFPRRRSIMIDHTTEDAQRMTPYFKGSPVGSAADL